MAAEDSARPRLEVGPRPTLVDSEIHIRATGLAPGEAILRGELVDDFGLRWASWARFAVGPDGSLDPGQQAPREGTYGGQEAEGPLWSMVPESWERAQEHGLKRGLDPTPLRLSVEQASEVVARAATDLLWLAPGVEQEPVGELGLDGVAFTPPGPGPFPPVLVFGGSDGGLRLDTAALLAAHGFFTLALAYFRHPGLPRELVEIPLEYFGRALDWLRRDPRSQPGRGPSVVGRSRGGELALLLGATFPELEAVVAYVPSAVVHSGILAGAQSWQAAVPAWTLGGEPVPFLGHLAPQLAASQLEPPIALTPLYLADLRDWSAVEASAIPLERSRARILMLSGAADAMWPSPLLAELGMARLARLGSLVRARHLVFPEAGHRFVLPALPGTVTGGRHPADSVLYEYGGTPRGNARAGRLAHRAMLEWLEGPGEPQG